jgi:hypothetical protein
MRWFFLILILSLQIHQAAGADLNDRSVLGIPENPQDEDWQSLKKYDGKITKARFQRLLTNIFDPNENSLKTLSFTDKSVKLSYNTDKNVEILFKDGEATPAPALKKKLSQMKIVIDPANIGGEWGQKEDRSTYYKGVGRIQEGDINLIVAKKIKAKLEKIGAKVVLTHEEALPVCPLQPKDLAPLAKELILNNSTQLPFAYKSQAKYLDSMSEKIRVASTILLVKTFETRSRVAKVRKLITPDLTLVLQHNATDESTDGGLVSKNRNIFFIKGAFTSAEIKVPRQRLKMFANVFQDTYATEAKTAIAIAKEFKEVTGYPPVMYGDSATTRLVEGSQGYVVCRNLATNREHEGPVVVIEPYFMNASNTARRLVAGDFDGKKKIWGREYESIYEEYASCVVEGLKKAFPE